MTTRTYHVGLLQKRRTAVFQFRASIDELSCETLQYFGERETTKSAARKRLKADRVNVLAQLHKDYPGRFDQVRVE